MYLLNTLLACLHVMMCPEQFLLFWWKSDQNLKCEFKNEKTSCWGWGGWKVSVTRSYATRKQRKRKCIIAIVASKFMEP